MDFISYADSLRAKLHLGGARLPLLIGVTAIALAAIVALGFGAASLISSDDGLVVERAQTDAVSSDAGAQPSEPQTIFVHIGGAVASPGLYELAQGSRVQQAVDAAGGFSDGAAVDALNLARPLNDGEQVLVPVMADGQQAGEGDSLRGEGSSAPPSGAAGPQASGKVNINTASAAELQQLNGVGPSLSERIVSDRQANGPFSSIEDLMRVSGIGDKKFASLADAICVG